MKVGLNWAIASLYVRGHFRADINAAIKDTKLSFFRSFEILNTVLLVVIIHIKWHRSAEL